MVPTGHLLSHPMETQNQGREGQTPLLERHPNNPNRPRQIQHRSVSQATGKGENDNCLIEISKKPANTITTMLFKSPPQAPSALIAEYWRSHFVAARSSCVVLTAGPENQDGSSLPRVRSDLLLAAKAAVRQSLLPSLTIHTSNHPAAPPQHSCDQSCRAREQSTAGRQAASAPEAQPSHCAAGRHGHTTLLGLHPLKQS